MRYVAIAMLAGLAACSFDWDEDKSGAGVAGSGSGDARTFAISGFTAIDLRGADDVDVRVGTGFSVRAEGAARDLDRLRIAKDGSTLTVGRRKIAGVSWGDQDKVKVFVTLPRLAAAGVAGSGTMTVDRVEGAGFKGGVAGSGTLAIATLTVDAASFSIAGSGDVRAAVNGPATVNIMGSGDVDLGRGAECTVNKMGSGSTRCR